MPPDDQAMATVRVRLRVTVTVTVRARSRVTVRGSDGVRACTGLGLAQG